MPYLMTTGQATGGTPLPMHILARLNLNGQAISVGNDLKAVKVGLSSAGAKAKFAQLKAATGVDIRADLFANLGYGKIEARPILMRLSPERAAQEEAKASEAKAEGHEEGERRFHALIMMR